MKYKMELMNIRGRRDKGEMFFLCLLNLLLVAPSLTVRFPKWLHNPLQLTNIPLVAAPDLGSSCFLGEDEGVCTTWSDCRGDRKVLGHCTLFKSYCCKEAVTCRDNISLPVGSFTNPSHPRVEVGLEDRR